MSITKKYTTLILLVFALFALNGAELFHHHEDGEHQSNDKCQACIFSKTLVSALPGEPSPAIKIYHTYNEFQHNAAEFAAKTVYSSFSGRAPPPVSHI